MHIVHGWVSSPNGRGTIDILQSCLATVFLCTYSVLFLNIKEHKTRLGNILYKTKWVVFTIYFPEVTIAIAAEQWRATRQSVAEFLRLRRRLDETKENGCAPLTNESLTLMHEVPWTARHAFFADMGGLHLKCPDFEKFPIDSFHFLWLVENRHIEYPRLEAKTIMDRNKADVLTRLIMLLQVTWFTVAVVTRAIQHLSITTLELSTLAFACCTLHAFWFWRDKPLDVAQPITIECNKELRTIISEAAPLARPRWPYRTTPLDFLDPETRLSFVDPFFYGMRTAVNYEEKFPPPLVSSFSNATLSHKSIKAVDLLFGVLFGMVYFGINFAAWSFHFPSETELVLWRASSIILACIAAFYEFVCYPLLRLGQRFLPESPKTAVELARVLPKWFFLSGLWPLIIVYFCARSYIIIEGFVSLRALPATAFETVNWWEFVPHL